MTTADGRAVRDAEVVLLGLGSATTDSLGRFRFRGVPAGALLLRVQRLGFTPIVQAVAFDGVHSQQVELHFGRTPEMLAPVIVRDSARAAFDIGGFKRRRQSGQGIYLDEQDIARRHATRVEHLLAMLPGVHVDSAGVAYIDRGTISIYGDDCRGGVQIFIDGVAVTPDYSLRNLSTDALRGIEIYRGGATTPAELRSMKSVCGTVAIWTK